MARSTRLVILIKNMYTLWGRKRFLLPVTYFPSNGKGVFLKMVMSSAEYRLENNSSPTFKRNRDSVLGSVLDLTFTKGIHYTAWTCTSFYIGGCHNFPIVYKINAELNLPIKFLAQTYCSTNYKTNIHVVVYQTSLKI